MSPDTTGTQHIDPGQTGELPGGTGPGRRGITEEDFHRLHPKLVAKFHALGAFPEEARDLTQETLLRAHRGLDSFQGRSQLDTWVMSIAKKVWLQHCRDQCRQKRNVEEVSLEAIEESAGRQPEAAQNLEKEVVARDRLRQTLRAIRGLPEAMRQALILYVDGHKYRKIAVLLGVSENRVSSLIHQAREKVRREVSEQPADSAL